MGVLASTRPAHGQPRALVDMLLAASAYNPGLGCESCRSGPFPRALSLVGVWPPRGTRGRPVEAQSTVL